MTLAPRQCAGIELADARTTRIVLADGVLTVRTPETVRTIDAACGPTRPAAG